MFEVRKIESGEGADVPARVAPEVLRFHYACLLQSSILAAVTIRDDDTLESALLASGYELAQVRADGSAHNLAPLPAGADAAQGMSAHLLCSECGRL